jgi:hypothetical protein
VLRKRKYFNPQGWETFGEALREANVPQDLIGHEDRWRYITQTKRTPRSRKRQESNGFIVVFQFPFLVPGDVWIGFLFS